MGKPGNHTVWVGYLLLGCVMAVAACGSSHGASHAGASPGVAFAACMRAHGVPAFPDPSGGGGGLNLAGTGINPQSPAFKSARGVCGRLAPGGAAGGVKATASQFAAALRFARCMREHGYSSFPDPTRVDSPPGPILIVGAGLFFRVSPDFNPDAPPVKRVITGCAQQ